jgi:Flp pilus assembly protein TadB
VSALLAAGWGAALGLGVLLVVQGLRGRRLLPSLASGTATSGPPGLLVARVAGGLAVGIVVWAVTSWPVAGLGAAAGAAAGASLLGGRRQRDDSVARTEAIAVWVEMIRDTMAGAKGLEEALIASARVAPKAIEAETRRFAGRLEHTSLQEALRALGEDLDHPSADLVIVGLAHGADMERATGDLGELLSRLAESIRGDVRMRVRVEVGRARIRTSAKIVVGWTLATAVLLYVFDRDLLAGYGTLGGQLWLAVVFSVWAVAGLMIRRLGRLEMPERFVARERA